MSAGQYLLTVILSAAVSAGTYVVMHNVVPSKPVVQTVDVPQVTGLTPEQGRALIEPLGLLLVIDGEKVPDSDRITPGSLIEQRPLQGSRLVRGGEIHAHIATAPQLFPVPVLVGMPAAVAQQQLVSAGFRIGTVTEEISDKVPAGQVITTQPVAGERLRKGEAVSLQVAKATEQFDLPSLRGKSLGGARAALEQLGLVVGDVRRGSDDNAADGAVLRQSPAAGSKVSKGQKVDLVIND
ncbi:MAG: PASTA domain-containing protein [Polyangia bacterium]